MAASALLQMRHSIHPVLHLTSPHSIAWTDIFGILSSRLNLPLIASSDWISRLRKLEAHVPTRACATDSGFAHALAGWFQITVAGKTSDTALSNQKGLEASTSLAAVEKLGERDVLRWLAFWNSIDFL